MRERIHFFHTNDLHSHFGFWPRMQSFIKAQRKVYATRNEPSFLFDIGDHMDRSNIYTEATLGRGNVEILNAAQYDVVTIGNNEGITLSYEELRTLYAEAEFEVVVANLQALDGENPQWLKPYTILTTKFGTKIAVIGATAQFDAFYRALNWEVSEPRAKLIELAISLRDQVDIILCLSHLGITEDELLAKECAAIDVIFGSHTHHILPEGKLVNDVLLTGGGKFGQFIGHLTIEFDHDSKCIVDKLDTLYENALLPEVDGETAWLNTLHEHAKTLLEQPYFTTTKTYFKEWFHRSQLSNLFAHALLDYTQADCAMFNAGIFVEDMNKGDISAYDIHKILPHPINTCVLHLTGSELKEVFLQTKNEEWPLLEIKGLGFRGVIFGKLLTYSFKMNDKRELIVNGQVADPEKIYKLATLDLFTFGYFFPNFKYAKKEYFLPLFLRDIFRESCKMKFK
ncbi:bifunctional metallophosphatase/5'-nucleotidase [Solibacillus sp. FSL H8-0538]|uniref:bifunctional metallophosphatase/5'-nucleotidase n=1 Tax=Solibacillus sp. FSL H8-0538 TaxID=2921400 RepID=UPI0030FB3555